MSPSKRDPSLPRDLRKRHECQVLHIEQDAVLDRELVARPSATHLCVVPYLIRLDRESLIGAATCPNLQRGKSTFGTATLVRHHAEKGHHALLYLERLLEPHLIAVINLLRLHREGLELRLNIGRILESGVQASSARHHRLLSKRGGPPLGEASL